METRSSNSTYPQPVVASGPNICRVCLAGGTSTVTGEVTQMESIFSTVEEYKDVNLFSILVAICAPLGQREILSAAVGGAPERICRSCKWRLLAAYELHQTCLRSDDKLRERMEAIKKQQQVPEVSEGGVRIKQEILEPDDTGATQNTSVNAGNFPFLISDPYYPLAESTFMDSNSELVQEMPPVEEDDPNETLFEENYQLSDKGEHTCGICKQEFIYKSQCRTHIITKHDPSKPYKCDVCFFTITTELRLIRHKALTHGVGVIKIDEKAEETDEAGETVYTCKICSKTFNSLVRFKKHKSVHVAYNRPFKCDVCQYRFTSRSQLTQHTKLHQEKSADDQDSQDNDWQCEYCEEKLQGKRALNMHIRKSHPQELQQAENKERNDYKCIICSEAFARESVLNTHMKMHELLALEKERQQRQELEQLIKKETQAQLNSSLNESTTATASNSVDLSKVHIKKKSDVDISFICMICDEEFEERELLLRHQKKLHKELELNIVSGAQDADSTSPMNDTADQFPMDDDSQMVIDIDPAHLLTPDMDLNQKSRSGGSIPKCDICQRTFPYNSSLQQHIKNSHSEAKPFECKVCRMRFVYRASLQKHELTHSAQSIRPGEHGSMMFKCKVCSAKFLELKSLTVHLRIHRTDETIVQSSKKVSIFQCATCPQVFSEKVKLDEHVATIHSKQLPLGASYMRNKPDLSRVAERQQPMTEKEMFFGSLSIVKLEHPAERVEMETT